MSVTVHQRRAARAQRVVEMPLVNTGDLIFFARGQKVITGALGPRNTWRVVRVLRNGLRLAREY